MSSSSLGPLPEWARPIPDVTAPRKSDDTGGSERRGLRDRVGRGKRRGGGDSDQSGPAERPVEAVTSPAPSTPAPAAATPAEPKPSLLPPVQFEIDPNAPRHPEFGRRLAVEWFATKHVEVYEEGVVRLTGPLVASPPYEELVSIEYWADDTPKSTKEKLLGKVGGGNLRELGLVEPVREAVLTVVTTERTHTLREADATDVGAKAASMLLAASSYALDRRRRRKPAPTPEPAVVADMAPDVAAPSTTADAGWPAAPSAPSATVALTDLPPLPSAPPLAAPSTSWSSPSPTSGEDAPTSTDASALGFISVPPLRMPSLAPLLDGTPTGGIEIPTRSAADRLRDLTELHRDGLVSDEEFERKRQSLLGEL